MKNNFFHWCGLVVEQNEKVHKVGTDAVTLGAWIPDIIQSAETVLDVGTGSGILALAMAKAYPDARVTAIDFHPEAIALAKRNFQRSDFDSQIGLIEKDILSKDAVCEQYTLVVSNPPYYTTSNPSVIGHKILARHNNDSVTQWMTAFQKVTAADGHCCLIVPFHTAGSWIRAANDQHLYCVSRLDLFSFLKEEEPVRSLLHLRHQLAQPEFSTLTIYEKENSYTTQYLDFTGIATRNEKQNDQKG